MVGRALRLMSHVTLSAREGKLTKSQHVMFLLADMMTWCEAGEALCGKVGGGCTLSGRSAAYSEAVARTFAREVLERVYLNGVRILHGCPEKPEEMIPQLDCLHLGAALDGRLADMDLVAKELTA
jgi:hypothetical protein